jgi:hypothetical protein
MEVRIAGFYGYLPFQTNLQITPPAFLIRNFARFYEKRFI